MFLDIHPTTHKTNCIYRLHKLINAIFKDKMDRYSFVICEISIYWQSLSQMQI